ncbi:Cytochrome c, mono-and diheme variants [Citreimonas salinaria]|uniref:Cytochrome c, mono-and diheme variants n=1 Tax=Citreimonas salinaria TaxID=321339 RepID=A0A1H3NE93_9RHOB|nr:Cytochrome c, mono-and diheme variants [Citreimonas salinaria]
MRIMLVSLGSLAAAGVLAFVAGGFYDITAIKQHPAWVFHAIGIGRDTLVALQADADEVPEDFAPVADARNVALYRKHCTQCHGAPGVAPEEFALGMMPVPSNLVAAGRERPPEEIYWFIRYGLKMSGMPAWSMRMSEADMWRITALVEAFPTLSPEAYAELVEAGPQQLDSMTSVAEAGPFTPFGNPERGRKAMQVHACPQCHMIEGIVGRSDLHVGPPLDDAGARKYIAGVVPNTPENMIRWIMHPQEVDPLSAMPDLGVSEGIARDMAAYLYAIAGTGHASVGAAPVDPR